MYTIIKQLIIKKQIFKFCFPITNSELIYVPNSIIIESSKAEKPSVLVM